MKNQALTTTLAVLLAVSLSALVALIVSSEVIGAEVVADTPTAIEIDIVTPENTQPATADTASNSTSADEVAAPVDENAAPAAGNDDASSDNASSDADASNVPAPAGDDTADDEGSDDTDDATGDDTDTDDETNPDDDDDPGTGEPPCAGEVIDGVCFPPVHILCAPGYTLIDGECLFTGCPKPLFLQDGVCQELGLATPCDGEIIDGECVPPISILCSLGYKLVGQDCVFVGCPNGYLLHNDVCQQLGFEVPCGDGFERIGGVCSPVLVLDAGQIAPVCVAGFHLDNGVCVPDAKVNPDFQLGNLDLTAAG